MNAVGANYTLPADKQPALRRAVAVTWASIAFLGSIIVLMGLVMGSSQAMKTIRTRLFRTAIAGPC